MAKESTVVSKSYSSAFLLDKPKVSRILSILEQRFGELGQRFDAEFGVKLANGKRAILASPEDLFSLDNAVKNPITSLRIVAPSEYRARGELLEGGVYLNFGVERRSDIELQVESKNSKWANELFAELEEQVERTLLNSFVYRYIKSGHFVFFLVPVIIMATFLFIANSFPATSGDDVSAIDARNLTRKAEIARTAQDKLDFIFELERRRLKSRVSSPGSSAFDDVFSVRSLFLVTPILIIIVVSSYAIYSCYPSKVFAWGDYAEHYQALVSKRRTLWTVIVGAFLVGVVANLFVLGLPRIR